jgi:DNA repair protein RecN (Recombination protein N)
MLLRLEISNYAIIDHVVIDFAPELTVISGETGAGKSILLGALSLILGKRADTAVLRNQEQKCVVEGTFRIGAYSLQAIFEDLDIDYQEETIIRREISPGGKSRAFVNDSPVTLQMLEPIAGKLVQIHSQHETLDLASSQFQMLTVDTLADHFSLLQQYREAYHSWLDLIRKTEQEEAILQKAIADQDYLQFQLQELEAAGIAGIKLEELEAELKQLTHADDIRRNTRSALDLLEQGQYNTADLLRMAISQLQQIEAYDTAASEVVQRLNQLHVELDDILRDLARLESGIQADPSKAEQINEQLSGIYRMFRKHHCDNIEDLLRLEETFADQLRAIQTGDERIAKMRRQIVEDEKKLRAQGKQLHDQRQSAAKILIQKVEILLAKVGMKDAKLEVLMEALDKPGINGTNSIEFRFSANKGLPAREISKVASGGELSRLMLCIKSLLASSAALPTLLFDEIDTGVSGAVADQVGDILQDLALRHQVITITHLPQIAAKGNHHLLVYKMEQAGKAATSLRLLDKKARIDEIARMLSGDTPGKAALANAKDLLKIS